MEVYAQGVNDGRRNGAGVAITDLQWLEPVRPWHTLTYTYEIIEKPDRVIRENGASSDPATRLSISTAIR